MINDDLSDAEKVRYVDSDPSSDAEIIQYAEPNRNTFTKKDRILRKQAKKKAIKTLTKNKKK